MKLDQVLSHAPKEWSGGSGTYSRDRYVRIPVPFHSEEWKSVRPKLPLPFEPFQFERVQNPYTFGRYLLQKEKMIISNNYSGEECLYHTVHEDDLSVALEHNLDTRHYTTSNIYDEQNKFSKNVQYQPDYVEEEQVIIVVKALKSSIGKTNANYYITHILWVTYCN